MSSVTNCSLCQLGTTDVEVGIRPETGCILQIVRKQWLLTICGIDGGLQGSIQALLHVLVLILQPPHLLPEVLILRPGLAHAA